MVVWQKNLEDALHKKKRDEEQEKENNLQLPNLCREDFVDDDGFETFDYSHVHIYDLIEDEIDSDQGNEDNEENYSSKSGEGNQDSCYVTHLGGCGHSVDSSVDSSVVQQLHTRDGKTSQLRQQFSILEIIKNDNNADLVDDAESRGRALLVFHIPEVNRQLEIAEQVLNILS